MGQRTPLIDVVKHTLQSPFLGLPLWQVATATVVGVVLLKYLRR